MTTITFGGGPTVQARRQFSNLKPGAQVPGYIGYIHQFKYNSGHTYGEQTHLLAEKFPKFARSRSDIPKASVSADDSNLPFELRPKPKYVLSHELPKAISGNKLTESMVPGYTGYIPSRKFHFSDTYRAECDQCIDEYMNAKEYKTSKNNSIINTVRSYDRHNALAPNSEIKTFLDHYRDSHPNSMSLQSDKRTLTEPPLPGYTGHTPKIRPTELGLGARYHETARKGFEAFKNDYARTKLSASSDNLLTQSLSENGGNKIFVQPGMVPRYTGYVHGLKYSFGNTYGEATRQLPVCNHSSGNFGTYMTDNPPKSVLC